MSRRTQFRLLVALTIAWAAWAAWSLLGQATPYTVRVIDDVGVPITAAVIDISGRQAGTTSSDGLVEDLEWKGTVVLDVSAPGHVPLKLTISDRPDQVVDAVLKARVLRGRVYDPSGAPVDRAVVIAGPARGLSDAEGRFNLRGAEPGEVIVQRPAWVGATFVWDGGPGEAIVEIEPFVAKAVHMTGEAVGDRLDEFIRMAMESELNALMIDLKDETGLVWYDSLNPIAHEVGAVEAAYDLSAVVARAQEAELYVIGRLVAFQDPTAAVRKPSLAVWDTALDQPFNSRQQYFLDPTDPETRRYALELAVEACGMGVDEVQFDYVRFPDVRPEAVRFDGGIGQEARIATINGFLSDAVSVLHPMGCAVAADVFGFITANAVGDGGIGQRWEDITELVDVASPMVYPSHYDNGWYGYDVPNDHPGPMVSRALEDGIERLTRRVVIRPWLQDFGYTPDQVRAQIESAEAYGLGWMLWNAASNVTTEALRPAR